MRRVALPVLAMATFIAAAPALATSFTPTQLQAAADGLNAMRDLNLITFGNASLNSDIGGKVFVGGNLTANSVPVNSGSTSTSTATYTANANYATLTVGGNVVNQVQVNNALHSPTLSASIGGTGSGNVLFNANGATTSLLTGQSSAIATQKNLLSADLTTLSSVLAGQSATTITNFNALTLAPGGSSIFNMSAALFNDQNAQFDNLFSNLQAGETVIINVAGTALAEGGGVNFNGNSLAGLIDRNVIWNFTDATSVSVKSWYGSILAPNATVSNISPINGSVVAQMFSGGGEIHLGTFDGYTPFVVPPPPSPTPEPTTWLTMIAGLGMVGGALRRKRRLEHHATA